MLFRSNIKAPDWLRERFPGLFDRPTDAGSNATPDASNGLAPKPAASSGALTTAQRETRFLNGVRSSLSTALTDAALLDLGRSACTAIAQGGGPEQAAAAMSQAASGVAAAYGVSDAEVQAASQTVLGKVTPAGLCGS